MKPSIIFMLSALSAVLLFSDSGLVLQAALENQGVALSNPLLFADDVAAGRLVVPFGPPLDAVQTIHVVSPAQTADVPKIARFREWLLQETTASIERLNAGFVSR